MHDKAAKTIPKEVFENSEISSLALLEERSPFQYYVDSENPRNSETCKDETIELLNNKSGNQHSVSGDNNIENDPISISHQNSYQDKVNSVVNLNKIKREIVYHPPNYAPINAKIAYFKYRDELMYDLNLYKEYVGRRNALRIKSGGNNSNENTCGTSEENGLLIKIKEFEKNMLDYKNALEMREKEMEELKGAKKEMEAQTAQIKSQNIQLQNELGVLETEVEKERQGKQELENWQKKVDEMCMKFDSEWKSVVVLVTKLTNTLDQAKEEKDKVEEKARKELESLNASVIEKDGKLKKLECEARQYRTEIDKLTSSLKVCETKKKEFLDQSSSDCDRLQQEIEELNQDLCTKKRAVENLEGTVSMLNNDIDGYEKKEQEANIELKKLKDGLEPVKKELCKTKENLRTTEQNFDALKADFESKVELVKRLGNENDDLNKTIHEAQATRDKLQVEISSLETQHKQLESYTEKLQMKLKEIKAEAKLARETNEDLRKQIHAKKEETEENAMKMLTVSQSLQNADLELGRMTNNVKELRKKLDDSAKIAHCQRKSNDKLKTELQEKQKKLKELTKESELIRQKTTDEKYRACSLSDEKKELEDTVLTLEKELQTAQSENKRIKEQLEECQKKVEDLGKSMENLEAEGTNMLEEELEGLKYKTNTIREENTRLKARICSLEKEAKTDTSGMATQALKLSTSLKQAQQTSVTYTRVNETLKLQKEQQEKLIRNLTAENNSIEEKLCRASRLGGCGPS